MAVPGARVTLPQLSPPPPGTRVGANNNDGERSEEPEEEDEEEDEEDEDEDAVAARWEGRANFFVAVRLRPRVSLDRLAADEIVRVANNCEVVVRTPLLTSADAVRPRPARKPMLLPLSPAKRSGKGAVGGYSGQNQFQERRFTYDRVFSPRDGQAQVYALTARSLIPGVLRGCNATVLAYGCTGAGKTFTMLGSPEDPGIMARALDDLFRRIARRTDASDASETAATVAFRVAVSFLEVYNETIRDLLSPAAPSVAASAALDLREDPVRGVATVAGLSEIEVRSAREVLALLRKGHRRRAQEATAANGASSRSHALLQVLVEQRTTMTSEPEAGAQPPMRPPTSARASTTVIKVGKLSLVDLAGSERAAATQNRGLRLVEGANINRSLLALGNCINALADKSAGGGGAASSASAGLPGFVPYRDSKLTRLLKDALGGNCRTVLVANVSPSAASAEETVHTLQYAARARSIQTTVASNVVVWSTPSARVDQGAADEPRRSPRARQEASPRPPRVDEQQQEAAYAGVISGLRGEINALRRALDDQQHGEPTRSLGSPSRVSPPPPHKSPLQAPNSLDRPPLDAPVGSSNNGGDEGVDSASGVFAAKPHSLVQAGEGDSEGYAEAPTNMDAQVHAARRVIAEAFASQRMCARELRAADSELQAAIRLLRAAELPTCPGVVDSGPTEPPDALPTTSTTIESSEASAPSVAPSPVKRVLALKRARDQLQTRLAASDARLRELRRRVDALPVPSSHASPSTLAPGGMPMSQSLVRELLLLEFRVGELEADKLALELRCGGAAIGGHSTTDDDAWLSQMEQTYPESSTHTAPVSVSALRQDATAREDLLVERLAVQAAAAAAASPASPTATARRQWGIQMRNPSLPYIRRKKRPPPIGMATGPAPPAGLPTLLPVVSGRAVGGLASAPTATLPTLATSAGGSGGGALAALTAPYLKVLKQRQQRTAVRPRAAAHTGK